MQPNDPPDPATTTAAPAKSPSLWKHVQAWDGKLSVAKGLTIVTLAMSQLDRIRVKYRPSGFFCHVPLVRDAIGVFSKRCTPVRTAEGANT